MKAITKIEQLDLNKRYTYADYLTWQFSERLELIKGKIFKMSPAPNKLHQSISRNICGFFWEMFKDKSCHYFDAPFDVRLIKTKKDTSKITTVIQPDICIVCDEHKLDDAGCIGAPDLIVEILSPGNTKKEMGIKFDLYEENKVKEYWIVDPERKTVIIYVLEGERFIGLKPFTVEDTLRSTLFTKMRIPLAQVFE